MSHRIVKIVAFKVLAPHTLWLQFDDGLERTIDFSRVLAGEIYEPLRDPEYFRHARLDSEIHTIVWPNGADFDPETLHDWPTVESAWKKRAEDWNQHQNCRVTSDGCPSGPGREDIAVPDAAGQTPPSGANCRQPRDVTRLAGTWTAMQAEEFDRAVASFGQVDEDLWK